MALPSATLRRTLAALLLAALLVALPRVAQADSTVLQNNKIPTRAGTTSDHPLPFAFSFTDCEADETYTWTVAVDTTSDVLQVWAGPPGADCTAESSISGSDISCWAVTPVLPTSSTMQVTVHGRDVVEHIVDQPGTTSFATYAAAGEDACHKQQDPDAVSLTLYFLLFQGGDLPTTLSADSYPLTVDTLGPPAPCPAPASNGGTGIDDSLGIGDGELTPTFSPPTGTDVAGMRIFCTPFPGREGKAQSPLNLSIAPIEQGNTNTSCSVATTTDAAAAVPVGDGGDGGDGSVDGDATDAAAGDATSDAEASTDIDANEPDSGDTSASCGTSLVGGMNGSLIPPDYQCGDYGVVSQATINGLTDGTVYSFAVGATDEVGNVGPITFLGCSAPQSVQNFYGGYLEAGGSAGGGFCSVGAAAGASNAASGAGTSAALVAVGAVVVFSLVRRRRQRR